MHVAIAPDPLPPVIVTVGGSVYPYPVLVIKISFTDWTPPTEVVIATAVAVFENSEDGRAPNIPLVSGSPPGSLIVTVGIPVYPDPSFKSTILLTPVRGLIVAWHSAVSPNATSFRSVMYPTSSIVSSISATPVLISSSSYSNSSQDSSNT